MIGASMGAMILVLSAQLGFGEPGMLRFMDPIFGREIALPLVTPEESDWYFPADEITLRFRSGVPPAVRERVLDSLGARILRRSGKGDYLAARLGEGLSLAAALPRLVEDEAVLFAEPRYQQRRSPFTGCDPENFDDPLLEKQWPIENRGGAECFRSGVDIDLPAAWAVTCGVPEVVVVVIDSGADLDHPDLRDRLYPRGEDDWNFALDSSRRPQDALGHGTAVAGLAVASAGNGQGISGVAPGCRLMPLRVDGLDLVMNVVEALDYVTEISMRRTELRFVVNGSLNAGGNSIAVREAVARCFAAGVVLCFSAGNGGAAVDEPAAFPESIAVGAIGPDGTRKRFRGCNGGPWASSHGPELDLVAPGVILPTTDMLGLQGMDPGDYVLDFGGTSAASPIVAGVAALMLSANPRLTSQRVREILYATAVDGNGEPSEDAPGFDEFMGWGRVDAGRAVTVAAEDPAGGPGDLDCDGQVRLDDVLASLAYLFQSGRVPLCPAGLEANGDGQVNLTDPVYVLQWLYQGGPAPRA